MERLELIFPTVALENQAIDFRQEHFDNKQYIINGSALRGKTESYSEWLKAVHTNADEKTVDKNWVVSKTFFAIQKEDKKIVGIIDIRHDIESNEMLRKYGGHIGYDIRPTERNKGYATEMLRLALEYFRNIGLERVMLGCYSDNISSIRVIEKCGGKLADRFPYTDGRPMQTYYIRIKNGG